MKNQTYKTRYGHNIFVTGASGGIGRACALAFAREGCRVTGISRSCKEVCEIFSGGGTLRMIRADVTAPASIRRAVKEAGAVDIAVLSAGMGVAGPVEELPPALARQQMEVNYFGVLNTCAEILPLMRRQKKGLVVVISSIAGRVPIPMQSHYSSSKYALEAYVSSLRMEMKRFGVRACLIEPGDTATGFTDARRSYDASGSVYEDVFKASIAKMARDERNGKPPESVAQAVLKAASKKEPPVRVAVGADYKALMFLLRFLPDRLTEQILTKMYLPEKASKKPDRTGPESL